MKLQKRFSKAQLSDSGYTYTNTRVKAMKAKLLKREEFQKFHKMSFAEIARYLQETEYGREINELSMNYSGANLIEYALNRNLENTFAKILGFAIRRARLQINLYLRRYDIANIKTILRGKFANMPNDKITNELIACGLPRTFLERVIKESTNAEQAIEHFKRTEYYTVMEKFANDLTKMEDRLDKLYYAMVLQWAEKVLRNYIRKEIFVKNALNGLRAKKSNIKVDIISGEKKLAAPYQEDSIEARIYMKKLLIRHALRMVHEVKRNIRPVLGYFIAKENEVRNIRLLTRGRHAGLSEEVIQRQLVI